MSPIEIILLLVLAGYGVWKQTQKHQMQQKSRFTMGSIYLIVGLVVGGLALPGGFWGWVFLVLGLALSAVFGAIRGLYTRVWRESDGTTWAQGNALTVTLFITLIVAKFGLGTIAYLRGITENSGFGEVLVMIGLMMLVQAQLVWRRAQALTELRPTGGRVDQSVASASAS